MENVIGTHSAGTYIHTYNKIFFYIENKNIIINNLIGKTTQSNAKNGT